MQTLFYDKWITFFSQNATTGRLLSFLQAECIYNVSCYGERFSLHHVPLILSPVRISRSPMPLVSSFAITERTGVHLAHHCEKSLENCSLRPHSYKNYLLRHI